jgi:hypothetical protein
MTAPVAAEHRTYGGWIKPKGFGLPGLGTVGTFSLIGWAIIAVFIMMIGGLKGLAVWAIIGTPPIILFLHPPGVDRDGWQIVGVRAAAYWRKLHGTHMFVRGHIGEVAHGVAHLPGLLADSEQLTAHLNGVNFGIIHLKKKRHYAVVLGGDLNGADLVDPETEDTWVACFGRWLSHLGHEDSLVGATVTITTSGDPGHRLAAETRQLCPDNTVNVTKQLYTEIREHYPRSSPNITAHIGLTFSAKRIRRGERDISLRPIDKRRPRDEAIMGAFIAERLPAHIRDLNTSGISNVHPWTADEITEYVRGAYDLDAVSQIDERRAAGKSAGIAWENAGPVYSKPAYDHFIHDRAVSVTFEETEPPQGAVESRVLEPILSPSENIDLKRVTLIYSTHDPAEAAGIADRDRRTAYGRSTERKGEGKAEVETQLEATRATARARAHGAGLTRKAMLVTVTVRDPDTISVAANTATRLGRASSLALRPCFHVQDSAFMGALGVGIILSAHTTMPQLEEWK